MGFIRKKKNLFKRMRPKKPSLPSHEDKSLPQLKKRIASLEKTLEKSRTYARSLKKKVLARSDYLRHLNKELEAISQLSDSMASFPDFAQVLELVTSLVAGIMKVDACTLRLYDEDKKLLIPGAVSGLGSDYLHKTPLRPGEGVAGLALKTRAPVLVRDVLQDERVRYPQEVVTEGHRAVMAVPILFYDEALGTLSVYAKVPRVFTNSEVSLLSTFASQAAVALKNARLHEGTQMGYLDTINALVMAMEARHSYTRGHAERVTRYALGIARMVNLSENEMDALRYTGKLHDVGKIAIPDRILDKPGKLTVTERAQIELHPGRGAEMLEPLKFLHKSLCIVRNHHERYDGKGYPDGLVGESIPPVARIMSLADAFDAMTTDRPYRKAMGIEEAVLEIQRNTGTQFDPRMAECFLELLHEVAA